MGDAFDGRNARAFDVPDNNDEVPRVSDRAAARHVTSEHAGKKAMAAKPAVRRARSRLSIGRASRLWSIQCWRRETARFDKAVCGLITLNADALCLRRLLAEPRKRHRLHS
jgi:hypothetical protein